MLPGLLMMIQSVMFMLNHQAGVKVFIITGWLVPVFALYTIDPRLRFRFIEPLLLVIWIAWMVAGNIIQDNEEEWARLTFYAQYLFHFGFLGTVLHTIRHVYYSRGYRAGYVSIIITLACLLELAHLNGQQIYMLLVPDIPFLSMLNMDNPAYRSVLGNIVDYWTVLAGMMAPALSMGLVLYLSMKLWWHAADYDTRLDWMCALDPPELEGIGRTYARELFDEKMEKRMRMWKRVKGLVWFAS